LHPQLPQEFGYFTYRFHSGIAVPRTAASKHENASSYHETGAAYAVKLLVEAQRDNHT
jgi:hypothetical protein